MESKKWAVKGLTRPTRGLDALAHARSVPWMVEMAVPRRPSREEEQVGGQGTDTPYPGIGCAGASAERALDGRDGGPSPSVA